MSVTIGIDPHKSTHTAVAVDCDEHPLARLTLPVDRHQTDRLLAWAEPLDLDRVWAIESAAGLGRLLAQQLIASGETRRRRAPDADTPGCACLAHRRDPRTIQTTRTRPRSPDSVTVVCAPSPETVTPRSCACSRTAITTSSVSAHSPRVDFT